MPGNATGTCRRKHESVAVATSSTEAGRGQSFSAITMLGLSSMEVSETTIGTRCCSWHSAAYRARACAFTFTHAGLGACP